MKEMVVTWQPWQIPQGPQQTTNSGFETALGFGQRQKLLMLFQFDAGDGLPIVSEAICVCFADRLRTTRFSGHNDLQGVEVGVLKCQENSQLLQLVSRVFQRLIRLRSCQGVGQLDCCHPERELGSLANCQATWARSHEMIHTHLHHRSGVGQCVAS
jgi:hypothetical protein